MPFASCIGRELLMRECRSGMLCTSMLCVQSSHHPGWATNRASVAAQPISQPTSYYLMALLASAMAMSAPWQDLLHGLVQQVLPCAGLSHIAPGLPPAQCATRAELFVT